MLATAGLWQSRIFDDYDTKLLPLLRKLKIGCARATVLDAQAIHCRPSLAGSTYRNCVVARRNRDKRELSGCGSCSGILALAVRRDQLHSGHHDGFSRRIAQGTLPGIRRRAVEKRNLYECQGEYERTSESAGPRKHRESLYSR